MPDRYLFLLAEKYGQSPGDVENWDTWHLNRAVILLETEYELDRRREKRLNDARRRK